VLLRRAAAGAAALAALGSAAGAATGGAPDAGPPAADVAAGERVFRSQCMGCHSVEEGLNRAGPTLHGIFGRAAGSVEGFRYSEAMSAADFDWTPETLDAFLTDPGTMVPGTIMVFWGLRPDDRRRVIAYLEDAAGPE
jgi:cytochrome c